jgi:hypothetical protein
VRQRGNVRIGWVLSDWDAESQAEAIALAPEFLFCNERRLPPPPAELWAGVWRYVIYEIVDKDRALALQARGVDMIETMAVGELRAALDGEQPS